MNYLFKTIMCGAAALMLAGTSVAQTKPAFTEVDFFFHPKPQRQSIRKRQ